MRSGVPAISHPPRSERIRDTPGTPWCVGAGMESVPGKIYHWRKKYITGSWITLTYQMCYCRARLVVLEFSRSWSREPVLESRLGLVSVSSRSRQSLVSSRSQQSSVSVLSRSRTSAERSQRDSAGSLFFLCFFSWISLFTRPLRAGPITRIY